MALQCEGKWSDGIETGIYRAEKCHNYQIQQLQSPDHYNHYNYNHLQDKMEPTMSPSQQQASKPTLYTIPNYDFDADKPQLNWSLTQTILEYIALPFKRQK